MALNGIQIFKLTPKKNCKECGCPTCMAFSMKVAAAYAIAGLVSDEELTAEYILPAAFDPRVKDAVAKAVAEAARKSGVARI